MLLLRAPTPHYWEGVATPRPLKGRGRCGVICALLHNNLLSIHDVQALLRSSNALTIQVIEALGTINL